MVGVHFDYNLKDEERFQARLNALSTMNTSGLLGILGALIETQTRRRLSEEKESPSGKAWPEWSDSYKEKRHGGHSLLENEGNLIDSIDYFVEGQSVHIGSNLVYAAHHQLGGEEVGTKVPQRTFLGLSKENKEEIYAALDDFMERAVS